MTLAAQPDDWTREQWLAWRLDRIGGSDVAALCGLSRFASPMSVFVDKCQLGAPRDATKAMIWGQIHEPNIARAFEEETGLFVLHPQTLAVDDKVSWRGATLDGLVAESPDVPLEDHGSFLGLCEIKCSSDYAWDELPDEYAVQIQWQMGVAGFERCWVPVLHQGNNDRIYGPFDFDPGVFAALCGIADWFWTENVLTQTPPTADGSDATAQALKAAFSAGTGEAIELSEELIETAKALPAAEARVKAAEAELQKIQNTLRLALGESPIAGVRDRDTGDIEPLITLKPQSSGARLDTKRLKAELPDIAREYTPPAGTTRVLRKTKTLLALVGEDDTEGAR